MHDLAQQPPTSENKAAPTIKFDLEHCFCTNWAPFKFYPTKVAPFEPQFHSEFENEGPRASFFDFGIVFNENR